jgi:hypothetical protein
VNLPHHFTGWSPITLRHFGGDAMDRGRLIRNDDPWVR